MRIYREPSSYFYILALRMVFPGLKPGNRIFARRRRLVAKPCMLYSLVKFLHLSRLWDGSVKRCLHLRSPETFLAATGN